MRTICAGLMAVALLTSTAAHADDNTGVCVALEAHLAQIDRGPAPGQDPHQYDAPIARQQDQLDRATSEAHDAGCMGGFLFFKPRPEARCGQLMMALGKMQASLQRLEQARAQLGGDSFATGQQRSDLLRQLSYNRCAAGSGQFGGGPTVDAGRNFLRDLFGGDVFQQDTPDAASTAYGTYRTLCVRTCDGYYFPLSFSTVPDQFGTDAATCQAMCPGTDVELYTYRNPGQDVTQMVSLTGQPYSALPTAFKYRASYDKSCTCHAGSVSVASGNPPVFTQFPDDGSGLTTVNPPPLDAAVIPPTPNPRPLAAGEDPATLDDRAGGLIPAPVTRDTAPAAQTAVDSPRTVRIVGPNYYYGQ